MTHALGGEVIVDFGTDRGAAPEHAGGSPTNVAVGLARLGTDTDLPFHAGAREIVARHDAGPSRQVVDAELDALLDAVVDRHGA